MTGGKTPRGYTIVEVLIFLAVSSMMFLLAANFINGKQSATEFRQGMTDAEAKINSVLNDVANGTYPSTANFTCSVPIPSDPNSAPRITTGTTSIQGENKGCILFGRVMQFGVGADTSQFRIYSVTARQSDKLGAPVQSFANALPVAIDSTATGGSAFFDPSATAANINLTESGFFQLGLEVEKAFLCTTDCSAGTAIGMLGFFGSLGNYGISTNADPQSGAQSVISAIIPNSNITQTQPTAAQLINNQTRNITNAHTLNGGKYVLLCFLNGTRAGSITIGGGNSRQLTTQLEMGAGVPSVC